MQYNIFAKKQKMINILIFVDSFFPGSRGGGPTVSVYNLAKLLHKNVNILVYTKNHDLYHLKPYDYIKPNTVRKFDCINVVYLDKFSVENISKVINAFNPNLLYLNSFFSPLSIKVFFLNLVRRKTPVLIAPRGEFQNNALQIKFFKKYMYINFFKFFRFNKGVHFHATSKSEEECILNIFKNNRVENIQNIVSLKKSEPLTLIKDKAVIKIIFLSRITKKKNLLFALQCLSKVKGRFAFDIFGPIENISYWNKCVAVIDKMPSHVSVSYKGHINHDKVYKIMKKYNFILFPTLSENFGHVIVEGMNSGLVPIISNGTPWLDLQSHNAGWNISLDDQEEYVRVIDNLHFLSSDEYYLKSMSSIKYICDRINNKKAGHEFIKYIGSIVLDRT